MKWPAAMALIPFLIPGTAGAGEADGSKLFAERCVPCHQAGGVGAPGIAPPLAGTLGPYAATPDGRAYMAAVVVGGLMGPIRVQGQRYNGAMPSFAALADHEIAAVLNHVLRDFNAGALPAGHAPIAVAEIAAARALNPTPRDTYGARGRLVPAK